MTKGKNKLIALLVSACMLVSAMYLAILCCLSGSAEGGSADELSTFTVEGSGAAVEYVENDTYGPTGEYEYRTTLKEGDVLRYNEPVDLREAGGKEFFRLRLLPQTIGETDVQILSVTLTDAYDPSNYVRLTGTYDGNPGGGAYWKVGAADQPLVGYEAWNNMIHVDNQYGAWTSTYFGAPDSAGGQTLLYYNDTEKAFYVSSAYADSAVCFICDLDDGKYYSSLWEGFTTGEVYISVAVQTFAEGKTQTDVAVIAAAGNALDGYMTVSDTAAPDIVIDDSVFGGDIPAGTVGYPYPVFSAVAYDAFSGILQPEVSVRNAKGETIGIENGKFSVRSAGKYFIEYTVADEAGNRATEQVEISMVNAIEPIRIVAETEEVRTGAVGERVRLDGVAVSGGTGEVVRNIAVKDPQGKFCTLEGLSFVPQTAGAYTVLYSAQDVFSQKAVYRYEITVTQPSGASILLEKELPAVFLGGFNYTLPESQARNYATGTAETVTVSVREGGQTIPLSDGKYRPDGDEKEVVVVYSSQTASKEFTIPVIDIWKDAEDASIDVSAYFLAEGFTKQLTGDCLTLTSASAASATFANALLMRGFYADIALDGVERLELEFADSALYGCKITAVLENTDAGVRVSIGGKTVAVRPGSLSELKEIGIAEDGKAFSVFGQAYAISVFDNGMAFGGFSGDLARVTFRVADADGGSLSVAQINQQFINADVLYDMVRPKISLHSSYGGSFVLNETYTVCAAGIADELDPTIRTGVTVLKPDGSFAVALDGTVLDNADITQDYQILLDQYGSYYVSYAATLDSIWGNSFEYVVKAVDTTPPEIVIDAKGTGTNASLGKEVKIPEATVKDNLSEAENVLLKVYLLAPNGRMTLCTGETFTASEKGVYVLQYFAFDEEGNICVVNYEVNVG